MIRYFIFDKLIIHIRVKKSTNFLISTYPHPIRQHQLLISPRIHTFVTTKRRCEQVKGETREQKKGARNRLRKRRGGKKKKKKKKRRIQSTSYGLPGQYLYPVRGIGSVLPTQEHSGYSRVRSHFNRLSRRHVIIRP